MFFFNNILYLCDVSLIYYIIILWWTIHLYFQLLLTFYHVVAQFCMKLLTTCIDFSNKPYYSSNEFAILLQLTFITVLQKDYAHIHLADESIWNEIRTKYALGFLLYVKRFHHLEYQQTRKNVSHIVQTENISRLQYIYILCSMKSWYTDTDSTGRTDDDVKKQKENVDTAESI